MNNKVIIYILLLLFPAKIFSQDIHFSQFFNSPTLSNPALTGAFDGKNRFVFNGREQWNSVTVPYLTAATSAEFGRSPSLPNLASGISIFNDITGQSRFNTFQFNVTGAYFISFDSKNRKSASVGIQVGAVHKSIKYDKLYYDNQFNGTVFDPNIPSIEKFDLSSRIYPTVGIGFDYNFARAKRITSNIGIAVFNLNTPKQTFFTDPGIKLDRRLHIHYSGLYELRKKTDILPSVSFMQQGKYRELVFGASIKQITDPRPVHYRAFYAGVYTRLLDAAFISGGMEIDDLKWMITYDFNYSKLVPASQIRGGVEVSIIYIIKSAPERRQYKTCPFYM